MLQCPECYTIVPINSNFCYQCGADLRSVEPKEDVFVVIRNRGVTHSVESRVFHQLESVKEEYQGKMFTLSGQYILHCFEEQLADGTLFRPINLYLIGPTGEYTEIDSLHFPVRISQPS